MQQNKVFLAVAGHPRSGTTLLNRILNTHPDLLTTFEMRNLPIENEPFGRYYKRIRKNWWKRRLIIHKQSSSSRLQKLHNAVFFYRYIFEMRLAARNGVNFDMMMHRFHNIYPQIKVFGDKHPQFYLKRLEDIIQNDRIKTIIIYRDARDVVRSALHRSWNGNNAEIFSKADSAAESWVQSIEKMEAYAAHVHIIRYEDLVTDPQTVVYGVGEMLGIDPELFQTNMIKTDRIGKHQHSKNSLSEAQIAAVHDVAGSTLKRLGYI